MPRVSDLVAYAGAYLKAADLPTDRRERVQISEVVAESPSRSDPMVKLVLTLRGSNGIPWPRRLVLNRGNGLELTTAFGDHTDAWIGRAIELWSEPTTYEGNDTMGIKVAAIGNGSAGDTGAD